MRSILKKAVDDQSGITLMIVMLLLFLLTLLGMAMYFMSSTDIKISRNVYTGTRAFFAAEAGINEAIARLNLAASDPDYDAAMFNGPPYDAASLVWEYTFDGKLDNGDTYTVTISHKPDTKDLDGDLNTDEVVAYDKDFFDDPNTFIPVAGTGAAVEVIRSTGLAADGETTIVVEITKVPMDLKSRGAVTANSNVEIRGTVLIDGHDHDMDGNPLGAGVGTDMPGVITTSDNTVDKVGTSDVYGSPPIIDKNNPGGWDPAWGASYDAWVFPNSPAQALGMSDIDWNSFAGAAAFNGPNDGSISFPLNGTYIVQSDLHITDNGTNTGILIVHNPNYDPCKYDAAKVFADTGDTSSPCYTPGYDYTAPQNQPAALSFTGTGTFKGLIVADVVDSISGSPTVIGAIVSLSTIDVNKFGTGTPDILFSSEALNHAASLGYSKKLAWYKE
jgi:hypothetical protein